MKKLKSTNSGYKQTPKVADQIKQFLALPDVGKKLQDFCEVGISQNLLNTSGLSLSDFMGCGLKGYFVLKFVKSNFCSLELVTIASHQSCTSFHTKYTNGTL